MCVCNVCDLETSTIRRPMSEMGFRATKKNDIQKYHKSWVPELLWQRATAVIAGWFAGRSWANNCQLYT